MELSKLAIFTIILTVPYFGLVCAFELPKEKTFLMWSGSLESRLYDLVSRATQMELARNVYRADASVKVEKVNGERILTSVLNKLSLLLSSKKSALKKLVDQAEIKYVSFQKLNKTVVNVEDLSFVDVKASKATTQMSFSPRFRQPVSYERSGVHIPLEIFDGWMGPRYKEAWWHDSEILKGLNWSESLDEVFKQNRKDDPNLRWQYFGSYSGFMRVYPAFRWPDHPSLPDLFDVRRRSWYIHTSVTPKDVIMLIDRSGSVHGPTLDIMKITARALLNSLGENDYVNVAWFNNKVRWVVPCINTLVQATSQTRRLLGDAVEKLTESNLTSYSTALDFAFEQFRKFDEIKKPWVGSNCQKIVMFLSDGGTEWPTDLVGKHCNESRDGRIKIFTFACGPHPIPTVVLKEMACSTGGYFSPVTALGSVRIKIRDYVKVLSRPLAHSKDGDQYQWHNFHRDVGGLGMVTTVALPVFDKSPREGKAPNLLGVMGIDITIDEMTDLFPKHLLGSFGYSFAINTNGFVVFHPRLHDHIIYLEDPPNIYLTDLEGTTNQIEEMEISIIDGKNGSLKNVKSIVPVGVGHAVVAPIDYFYGAIEASTFRFGIALPSKHTVLNVEMPSVDEGIKILSSLKGASIAPWKYCSRENPEEEEDENEDITIEKLVELIRSNETFCDKRLIDHLLWDARNAYQIVNHWNEKSDSWLDVDSRFLITEGGLTVFRTSQNEENDHDRVGQKDPLKNNLFRRASRTGNFVFSPHNGQDDGVTVAGGITLRDGHVAAVVGVEVNGNIINEIFQESLDSDSDENCNSSEIIHCYLLNDGGVIVASNIRSSLPGNFIGMHDAELLEIMVAEGIIKREYRYNYQSWCSRGSRQIQAKASNLHSSILKCIYDAIAGFHWTVIYTAFLDFFPSIYAWRKSENSASVRDAFEGGNHSCVTRSAWYYQGGFDSHSGVLKCQLGTRAFRFRYLPELTLMFLVSQPPCDDSQYFRPVTLDASEDVEFHYCQNRQHYRLRPEKCYSRIPKEARRDCGASSECHTWRASDRLIFILALLSFILTGIKNH